MLVFLHFCLSPINPVIDAETLLFLNNHSRREDYGVHRLWGTYGWSVSTIVMGILLFLFGHDPLIFYGLALAFALVGSAALSGITVKPAAQPVIIPWKHLKKDRLSSRSQPQSDRAERIRQTGITEDSREHVP